MLRDAAASADAWTRRIEQLCLPICLRALRSPPFAESWTARSWRDLEVRRQQPGSGAN
jgi:hypothetical protein